MKSIKIFLSIIGVFVAVLSCKQDTDMKGHLHVVDDTDPVSVSFLKEGVRSVIKYQAQKKFSKDSIFQYQIDVNFEQRTLHKRGHMLDEKSLYDKNDFLIRYLSNADGVGNYLIRYFYVADTLTEKWNPIRHSNWKYVISEVDTLVDRYKTVVVIDPNFQRVQRKIISEIEEIFYQRNDKGLLLKSYNLRNAGDSTVYNYHQDQLHTIITYVGGKVVEEHRFDHNGNLNTTTRFDSDTTIYKYAYRLSK